MTLSTLAATGPRDGLGRYLATIVLVIAAAAVIAVVVSAPDHSGRRASATLARPATARRLPLYWIVRPGDSFMEIAARTGVSVARLQAFNPDVDPLSLAPGPRLKLWPRPPNPRPKPMPLGPLYWTVRPGQSFGSIAANTASTCSRSNS